jgi:hypothetical protein
LRADGAADRGQDRTKNQYVAGRAPADVMEQKPSRAAPGMLGEAPGGAGHRAGLAWLAVFHFGQAAVPLHGNGGSFGHLLTTDDKRI